MTAEIIDGAAVAATILADLPPAIAAAPRPPHLAAIRANADAGAAWYMRAQAKFCAENGVRYTCTELGAAASRETILAAIHQHNSNPEISAIILLLPLPPTCNYAEMVAAIAPHKDAEGVHPENLGRLMVHGDSEPAPCTARSAVTLIKKIHPELSGKKAVVVGRSAIVGKPAALLLLQLNATVTIAHSHSNLAATCRDADIIIAATGAAEAAWHRYQRRRTEWENSGAGNSGAENSGAENSGAGNSGAISGGAISGAATPPPLPDLSPLIKAEMVKPGATVIDVGVNQIPRGFDAAGEPLKNVRGAVDLYYTGDVDFASVKEIAGFITHPTGGVGPVTNAFLLRQTVAAASRH